MLVNHKHVLTKRINQHIIVIYQQGGKTMADLLEMTIPEKEQEEIKEFVSTLLLLSKEDRAILLSNANAFKVRRDIEGLRTG